MVVSFTDGGNQRKPPSCHKSLKKHNVVSSTSGHEWDMKSQNVSGDRH